MPDHRSLRRDLLALGLLGAVLFSGVSLATYDPADPSVRLLPPFHLLYRPDVLVTPPHEQVHNACGRWGTLAADLLLNALGVGAYYLVLSLGLLDFQLLRRQEIDAPGVRLGGWLLSLGGVCTLASLIAPGWSPGPVIGAGGAVGALFAHALGSHFALAGAAILCASMVFAGLLLCSDYALLRIGMATAATVASGVQQGRQALGRMPGLPGLARERRRRAGPVTDIEPAPVAGDAPPRVRIRGQRQTETATETATEAAAGANSSATPLVGAVEELEDGQEELDTSATDEAVESGEPAAEAAESDGPRLVVKKRGKRVTERTDSAHEGGAGPRDREPGARSERETVMEQLNEDHFDEAQEYELPSLELLLPGEDVSYDSQTTEVRQKAKILERTFGNFGYKVKVVEIETGPVIAQYEVELEAGLRLSKITGLADDLAIALRVPSVRIVAPIPGKNTVGIEVPNSQRQVVRLREVIEETNGSAQKMRIPLFLGKDVSGNPLTVDLSTLPHLLIAGRTGTGKSVCLNAIISSILMTRRPDEVRMLMIDPKMVELSGYGRLPHLMHPVVTDMRKAEAILAWAVDKMEERYALLARAGVRHISSYNQLGEEELYERLQPGSDEERQSIPTHLPFIVIVADEMADLMMTSGKEVEQHIIRLAQKSRAVGIHLILATQKPTVDVITGLIKSNLPARIAFQVASRTDSRVVLDEMGADKLLGNGDMLFLWPGTSTLLRGQGTYLSDDEIQRITDACSKGEQNFVHELVNIQMQAEGGDRLEQLKQRDDLYESAIDVVVREKRGSISLLQRALGIGYGRAARLIDFMAEDGIVGNYNGSSAREVVMTVEDWEGLQGIHPGDGDGGVPLAGPAPVEAAPLPATRSRGKRPAADEEDSGGRRPRLTAATAASQPAPKARKNRILPDEPAEAPVDDSTAPWEDEPPAPAKRKRGRRGAPADGAERIEDVIEEELNDLETDLEDEVDEELNEYDDVEAELDEDLDEDEDLEEEEDEEYDDDAEGDYEDEEVDSEAYDDASEYEDVDEEDEGYQTRRSG